MYRLPTKYTVWYQVDGFGTASVEVTAVDVVEAIQKALDPFRQKYGEDKKIYVVKVV